MITMPLPFLFSWVDLRWEWSCCFVVGTGSGLNSTFSDRTPRWRPLALTGLMVTGVVAGLYLSCGQTRLSDGPGEYVCP